MKILLVEDSASMRSYLANIIESGTEDDGVEIVDQEELDAIEYDNEFLLLLIG